MNCLPFASVWVHELVLVWSVLLIVLVFVLCLFVFVLCFVCPMISVSLDCSFLIVLPGFPNVAFISVLYCSLFLK